MSEQATFKLRRARLLAPEPQPWRRGTPPLAAINPLPSMICEDESRFLHWIARHHASGDGEIVDLGPLAGGSTHALCSGLALNPAAGRTRVHAYDLWRFMPGWERFFPGAALRPGNDLHPFFQENLKAFANLIVEHPGGLARQRWSGEPIAILFVDAAKAAGLWRHIARQFLPSCVPGALVIHQDWASAECPWIHLTMARLSEYLVPVDSPEGGSVAFRVERAVPSALLEEDFLALPEAVARARFARAESWMAGWYALEVRLAEAHRRVMQGRAEEAAALVDEVLAHGDYAADLEYDVQLVRAALRQKRDEATRPAHERLREACRRLVQRATIAIRARAN